MYNPQLSSVGYRTSSGVTIAPYAFNTAPQVAENKRMSAPVLAKTNAVNHLRNQKFYNESSSSSVSTASSSSNQSSHYTLSKDDSTIGFRQRQNGKVSTNMAASLSTPDLSIAHNQASQAPKPSPDRYRRPIRQPENASPPGDQKSQERKQIRPTTAPIPPYSHRSTSDFTPRPQLVSPQNAEDTITTGGSTSSRYKRRSVANLDSPVTAPSLPPPNLPGPSWSQVVAGKHNFGGPLPPPGPPIRPGHHLRSASSGENRAPPQFKQAVSLLSKHNPRYQGSL